MSRGKWLVLVSGLLSLFVTVRAGSFPLSQPDNLRSMVYVENVVAGILKVIEGAGKGVSAFILKDREDYSTPEIYTAICEALGVKPRFLSIPS